ncbi:MAG: hypothetical protein ACREBW_06700, partial [Candidatus Micrarchaeaceae archaeon]
HRVVADLVFDKIRELGELSDVLVGLGWALATKVGIPLDKNSRTGKFLIRIMDHDFLINTVGMATARDFYARLENLLSSDYHYWLQRGSLELEVGDSRKAENFLGSARSLGAGDFRVDTAYAYMLMKKACEAPKDLHAEEFLNKGITDLEAIIETTGHFNGYAFHVLGSQGLAWAHRAIPEREKRRRFLGKLCDVVKQGVKLHPDNDELTKLSKDLEKEVLLTTTVDKSTLA